MTLPAVMILGKSSLPKTCSEHKAPLAKGSFYQFELTDTEYNFWKSLSNADREKLREEAFNRCFFDALHEKMGNSKRLFHETEEQP